MLAQPHGWYFAQELVLNQDTDTSGHGHDAGEKQE